MKRTIILGFIALIAISFTSCKKKKHDDEPKELEKKVAIVTTVKNPDGQSGSSFLQLVSDFVEQNVDNKTAIPIPFASCVQQEGNHLYVFPAMMGDAKQDLQKYSYAKGTLELESKLALPQNSMSMSFISLTDQKAYISMWGLGKMLIFNPKTMTVIGEIDLSEYALGDKNPDPACAIIRDGLLFVGLSQTIGGFLPGPENNFADVVIIDTKTDKPIKLIREKESNMSFATRPPEPGTIFMDENRDIYIACVGGFGYMENHKSGFLRIKAGETEFDKDYSWDITETPIAGEPHKGDFIASSKYFANGKVYGVLNIPEYADSNPYLSIASVAVEFDLNSKSIKKIKDLPRSNSFSVNVSTYKDLVVFANYGETSGGFYSYDPKTEKVSNGPVITTTGNPTNFFDLNK